jgi:tRNA pseudouridine55 synthase
MEQPSEESRILLIDKPRDWTSFDVVNKIRYKLRIKKVGHAGTLDPLATGLLIICTGKMTKQIESFMGMEKEYTGTFVLGSTTPSHDLETEVKKVSDVDHVTEQMIHDTAKHFTGIISQVPPLHSAIKVGGKRSYEMARKGKDLELKPREVEVKEFEITGIKLPEVFFRVVCSKGTYIRSLARDFGDHLKTGAYLSALCRTRIGTFKLTDAWQLDEFVNQIR